MQYINNELATQITSFGKSDKQNARAGQAVAKKIHDACPQYEGMEAPDQAAVRSEISVALIQSYTLSEQKIMATKPADLSPEDQVKRTNLNGAVRAQVSRLIRLAFPKDRGHATKRSIEQYLIDTHKAVIKRCEATDRGEWTDGVKLSYTLAKQALAGIK
jgi:hypothetical protein